jgi:hypothetical protein
MRRLTFFLIALIFLILINSKPSVAQRTFPSKNVPSLKKEDLGACWQSSPLRLTEDQLKTLEGLQQAFIEKAMPLRRELMSLRFELRYLIRDQNVPSRTLLERQRKIFELQGELEALSLSYQIKARSILTKEQLEQLPEDCLPGIEPGFGMGISEGRRPRRGLR